MNNKRGVATCAPRGTAIKKCGHPGRKARARESFNPVIAGSQATKKARQPPYPNKKERDGTTKKDHQRSLSLCTLRSPREHRERKRQSERARRPEESDGTDGNHLCVTKENEGAGAPENEGAGTTDGNHLCVTKENEGAGARPEKEQEQDRRRSWRKEQQKSLFFFSLSKHDLIQRGAAWKGLESGPIRQPGRRPSHSEGFFFLPHRLI
jgi:hypothetical protein